VNAELAYEFRETPAVPGVTLMEGFQKGPQEGQGQKDADLLPMGKAREEPFPPISHRT
jgi:hypothetical protein